MPDISSICNYEKGFIVSSRKGLVFLDQDFKIIFKENQTFYHPEGLSIQPHTNHFLVCENRKKQVTFCSVEDKNITKIYKIENWVSPAKTCFSKDGSFYVTDENKVKQYDSSGKYIGHLDFSNRDFFSTPRDVCQFFLNGSSHICVTETLNRLSIWEKSQCCQTIKFDEKAYVFSAKSDKKDDYLFVGLNNLNNHSDILKLDPRMNFRQLSKIHTMDMNVYFHPLNYFHISAMCFDSNNNLWIAEKMSGKIWNIKQ